MLLLWEWIEGEKRGTRLEMEQFWKRRWGDAGFRLWLSTTFLASLCLTLRNDRATSSYIKPLPVCGTVSVPIFL